MEKPTIEFIFPSCNNLLSIVVTNNRKAAAQRIEHGYTLFTVPQLFGEEYGQIVLFRENGAMSGPDGMSILEAYESDARKYYSSDGTFSTSLKV